MDSNDKSQPTKIVFFDGICGLCNRTVDFLLRKDKQRLFRYAPLQGTIAKNILPAEYITSLSGIAYYRNEKLYFKSDAALMISWDLGGLYRLAIVFWIIPRFIRDGVYNHIARNRYKWFGRNQACRIPSPSERNFFLD
jgi:predicted DCC family thiol-disulfide oxidoreductase YuxK